MSKEFKFNNYHILNHRSPFNHTLLKVEKEEFHQVGTLKRHDTKKKEEEECSILRSAGTSEPGTFFSVLSSAKGFYSKYLRTFVASNCHRGIT